MEPLNQWVCDKCRKVIESPRDGYFQWLSKGDDCMFNSQYGFKIVHADPRCHFYGQPSEECGYPMSDFEGNDRYSTLLNFLDPGVLLMKEYRGPRVRDMREFVEIMRRFMIPYYEEARLYFLQLPGDDEFAPDTQVYKEENLKRIIEKYSKRKDV